LDIIRKAFWPAAVAIGFLVFLGAFTHSGGVQKAEAFPGDICAIEGPRIIGVGQTVLYRVRIEDIDEFTLLVVDIDDLTGDSDITSRAETSDDYEVINPTNTIGSLDVDNIEPNGFFSFGWDADFIHDLEVRFGFTHVRNVCGAGVGTSLANELRRIIDDAIAAGEVCAVPGSDPINNPFNECPLDTNNQGAPDIDCPSQSTCTIANATVVAIVNALVAGIAAGEDCGELAIDAQKAAIDSGAHVAVGNQVFDFILDVCFDGMIIDPFEGSSEDGVGFFDVTCNSAGTFEITAFDALESDNALSITVTCLAPGNLVISPPSVEIVPAVGNVSASLITVQAPVGAEVQFNTDRCAIETSAVDTLAELNAIQALFTAFAAPGANLVATSAAIQASAAVTGAIDTTPLVDIGTGIDISTATRSSSIAAAILFCGGAVTPGTANITVTIAQPGPDIILTGTVLVVGPPANVTLTPDRTNVTCGEQATLVARITDANGQPVSEHTRVEAVTNFGGVLGGTGAVTTGLGVIPLSSTLAETFGGNATFSLITSQTHEGPYTVIVTTGGGGSVAGTALGGVFSTPTVSASATVNCASAVAPAAPVATAAVAPPRTGTGITPPNTGDAGLASSNAGLSLFVIGGVVALALAGFAGLKLVRR